MILYTDGIHDATLDRGDEPRVAELLRGPPHAGAQTLADRPVDTVRRVDRPLRDDAAIIALRRRTLA